MVTIALLAAAAACNAILGNDASITYVDGDAQATDGRPDTATDTGAGADGDAGIDVASLIDVLVPSCGDADFCANFDPPNDMPPFGFTQVVPASAFPLDMRNVSPPNSVRVESAAGSNGLGPTLRESMDGGSLTLAFQLYVIQGTGDWDFARIACKGDGGASIFVAAGSDLGHASLSVDGDRVVGGASATIASGSWQRLLLVIGQSTVQLVLVDVGATLARPSTCTGPFSIALGLPTVRDTIDSGAVQVLFDDITADVNP